MKRHILTDSPEIKDVLARQYPFILPVKEMYFLERPTGSSLNYAVVGSNKNYFFSKIGWWAANDISLEEALTRQELAIRASELFRKKGLPVPKSICNKFGEMVSMDDGSLYVLEEFLGSSPAEADREYRGADQEVKSGARLLSFFHDLSEETSHSGKFNDLIKKIETNYDELLPLAVTVPFYFGKVREDLLKGQRPQDLNEKSSDVVFEKIAGRVADLDWLAQQPALNKESEFLYIDHIDFHPGNVLWSAVPNQMIDFDYISVRPDFNLSLAFSTIRFGQHAENNTSSRVDRKSVSKKFFESYCSFSEKKVDPEEIAAEMAEFERLKTFRVLCRPWYTGSTIHFRSLMKHLEAAVNLKKEGASYLGIS